MNTYSIHFNFLSAGFDINLFNQFDIYLSYALATVLILTVIILRVRKRVRNSVKQKKINKFATNSQLENPLKSDWDF